MSVADRLASLAPAQRALFEKLLEKQRKTAAAAAPTSPPPIPRVSGPDGAGDWPLSLDQERFWFMEQLYSGGAGLNIAAATRMRGRLSVPIVAAALAAIVRRHAAWRTAFPLVDGRPVQRVAAATAELRQPLPVIDLARLPAARREPEAARLVMADAAALFDLERGPLVRSSLVRMSAEDHLCRLTVHHLVTDWLSFQIAWAELAALYAVLAQAAGPPGAAGRPPSRAVLPEPPVHYPDFAVWQRAWLSGEVLAGLVDSWRERLAGVPPALDLPTDRPRPAVARLRGGRRRLTTTRALAEGLRALSRREGATLFMTVLAATAALLHRLHGEPGRDKLILGANNANRNRPEIEPVLGCFLTQVPFVLDLAGDPTWRDLLARARQSALASYAHQHLPFGQLVQALQLERDPSRQPLVQNLVQVLDGQYAEARVAGLEFAPVDAWDGRARYDLMLTLFDFPDGLVGSLEYDADLLDATTAERWGELLLLQAAAAVADPDLRLSALPALSKAARHQALCEWNDGAGLRSAAPPAWTVPERLAAQAARTPAAAAVVAAGEILTYGELDRRAAGLASRLRTAGVGRESRVALLLERTADVPIAILGVWKAGGAFVPLDPESPVERLADLLEDVEPAALVYRGPLPAGLAPEVPCLDLVQSSPSPTEHPAVETRSDQLAYLLYTSGTTGQPKAVMVEHGGLAAVLGALAERLSLGPGDRMPHLARDTFDASLLELFLPLLAGGAVEILPGDAIFDPEALLAALARSTLVFAVPALLRRLAAGARERGPREFAGLRAITTGADVVSPELQAELLATFPDAAVDVLYGPTEGSIVATAQRVARERPPERAWIGRPLPGVEVRVVDRRSPAGAPVPLGVPGELWIGGPGVARGYFRRAELSAERFVVVDGRRFYRTGDLVRQVPAAGGALEFLGRTDFQLKVRGFRIEPGEVEAALARHPAVRESVVTSASLAGTDRQLVAYVVAGGEPMPTVLAEELRAFLRALLPEHMVPAVFVLLPALPLTPNGKVDRAALPAPTLAAAPGATPPRDAREELLAAIWREVLGRDRVGVHDNFFQLGGDSILSIQVVTRARRAGLLVTPQQLFEHQTIAALAAVAGEAAGAAGEVGAGGESAGPVVGEAPLTPIQRRFFAVERHQPERFNQALLLAPREALAAAPLAAALARLAVHHDALRLRFVRAADGWRQHHVPIEEAALPLLPLLPLLEVELAALPPGERRQALERAAEALQHGLDLARGPVATAALFRLGEEGGDRLLLTAHHLVVDGVSWRVLLADLAAAYRQLAASGGALAVALPPKTTSFKRWAELLAAHARSAELSAELPAWLALLPAEAPALPVDLAAPQGSGGLATIAVQGVELDRATTRDLLQAAPEAYRTQVNDLLLTALARAFAGWTGAGTLLVDLEGHGREEIFPGVDLSRTVGWFTTVFPVGLELPPGGGPGEAIRAVKERLRAVPGRGLGYGLLRYLADGEAGERLAALPAPQVAFNYLGQVDAPMNAGAEESLFALAPEEVRGSLGEGFLGHHHWNVDALVAEGCLRVSWTYDPARHSSATAERLARSFLAELRALVEHCLSPEAGGATPSDFPLAQLDQEALDRLLGVRRGARDVEDLYPLAPLQEGILFHELYAPGSDLYLQQLTATLDGPLDATAFVTAWQWVVERHPALRTAFSSAGLERPLQLVRRGVEMPWLQEDWRQVPPAELPERLAAWQAADRARPFDLARAPLLRAALLWTGEREHRFVWTFHHLLLDGWCLSPLFAEVFTLYQVMQSGVGDRHDRHDRDIRDVRLPPVRPYRDFLAWLARQDRTAATDFFRQALAGFAEPTPLPFDRPVARSGEAGSVSEGEEELPLPAALAADLTDLAQSLEVTASTLVQGAWALLLARYGGVPDVVFGTVVSGRPAELPGVESMIGLFINTLPVRVMADPAAPLAAWLREVQGRLLALTRHETAALAEIQRASAVPPGEPLFSSLVAFENYPLDESLGEGTGELSVREVRIADRADYPLALAATPGRDRRGRRALVLRLGHDGRIDPTTARRLLGHLELLLAAFVADPARRLADLPALAAAERHQLLVEWNDTALPPEDDPFLHHLLAARARRAPAVVALAGPRGEALTWGELDRRANRLAHHLRALGVGPEARVALLAERSPELVVALLAILKAGGAYLPIDPETPADRIAFVLADSGAALLLAGEGLPEEPEELRRRAPGVPILPLAAALAGSADRSAAGMGDPPAVAADPAGLAYVIYTSGSTGTPKGVMVSHRALAAYARAAAARYGLGPADRALQFSSLGFDTSLDEIACPLAAGATLVLRSGEMAGALPRFLAEVERLELTALSLPTAFWHELAAGLDGLDGGVGALPAAVRLVVVGGEEAQPHRLAAWRRANHRGRRAGREARLLNAYGPTEGTITATFALLAPLPDTEEGEPVPLGRPLAGARVHAVDGALRPLPLGAWGELLVGGGNVARGYLGRPERTAERFVPDPWSGAPGERAYRTGDRVRFRPDGELLFGGRLDQQVKIRGFRVEPAEIEAALAEFPGVPGLRAAAVVARRTPGGDRALLACVVPADPERPPDAAELRSFLAGRLPAHLVPAAFAFLPRLPLTPNGKVDRRALAELRPEAGSAVSAIAASAPPRTPLEARLARIWEEVLGIEGVGRSDSFLVLGGHSLAAARLVARVQAALGVEIPLRAVFETGTLAELAELAGRLAEPEAAAARPRRPEGRGATAPLSFAQERLWFVDRLVPGNAAFNMPFPLLLDGALDLPALARACREVRRRQGSLRTRFVERDGAPVQMVDPPGEWTLPRVDLDALPAARGRSAAERLAEADAARPFDLARGPLFRPLLVRLGEALHLLLLTCHHIVSDGASQDLLLRELGETYAAFCSRGGAAAPLPDLPLQYVDSAAAERERLSGAALAEQVGHWRQALAGLSPLDLPADRPRRPVPTLRGGVRPFRLPAGPTALLRRLARGGQATLFMALHAGGAALLSRLTGRSDLPLGTTVSHRTRAELEDLIGFFVNTLVLRADLKGDPGFADLIARSREVALAAYAHQDLPFEKLVDELGLPRDPYRPPLLRVLLQLHDPPSIPTELPGLTLAPFELALETAKLDLVINLVEAQEGLAGELRYDADLFDGATIERLAGHFARLLAAWVADPARPLFQVPFVAAAEEHQLLQEWNAGEEGAGRERRALHHRFAEQVDRTPDAMAVVAGGERLTYGELERRANRIAWHLMAAGVRPGDRVALCLERSAGMIAAILGVLKAGAAYVPLDPAHPAERLAFTLEDSGASLVLTEGDLLAGLVTPNVPVIRLDEARMESARRPEVPADPALPAYVIYTSGSTGRPKGVVVSHAHVDRLFTATASAFDFGGGPGDTWTFFHSYAFDFSVWEIWGALLHGGRLIVVPYWESRSPEDFYRLLQDERVTVLSQTPSAFRQLLWAEEAMTGGAPPELALRWVIFGGEALEPASLASWFERHGDRTPTLVNMYGITETTVHVTWRPIRTSDLHRGSLLGRPLPDLSLYVLDAALRPQPIGVPGEIHVGGAGLAQGYFGQPERTAERFLPDPFSGEPGARLYRSGDLARRLPDGDLEYLGRIDHQVKIRGFRIELGEIEAALTAHPQVREAVVLARDGGSGERRLVAYVVPAPGEHLDPADLRAHLADRLPEPMLPAAFVLLEALPLTVNGKVDRQALPAPEAAGEPAPRRSTPPATPLERFLAGQFRAVLGLPEERAIGSEDDFFALGGSSISGAILIHRLQETLGEIVHVVTIFDHPTVAALAGYVEREHPAAARRLWGVGQDDRGSAAAVGPAEVAFLRRLIVEGRPESAPEPAEPPNPPALFVLSPPRSGSTLLRVMLGAHPRLFSPPELELLSFRTMAERHAAFSGGEGRERFWLEGLVRAVMEARQVEAMEAERIIEEAERQGWTTRRFYRELSTWLSGRMLVDKTPSYSLDPEVLARAEAGFAGARYLHLVRHPQATNRSFVEAKMEQIVFRRPHPFTREQLAELVWTVSHRNILDFLAGVPRERRHTVHFEDLVRAPERVLAGICDFLGIEYRPEMADPYKPGAARMVDGPHAVSRMLGDVKFLGHGRVDPTAAERWRGSGEAPLGEPARELAAELGYKTAGRGVLARLQEGAPGRRPLFCVHPVGGEVVAYHELARRLGPDEPVYGLQSPEPPIEDLQPMAAVYLEALRSVQPAGPYRLAGWSMGGLVAYEMACQLAEQGERVDLLALIDCASPAFWAAQPVPSAVGLVAGFALDLARLASPEVPEVPEVDLSGLDEEGALALVLDRGRRAGVLAPGVELAELRRLFARYRANRRALATCVPRPYCGQTALFRAAGRPPETGESPDLGWSALVPERWICDLPGDHYSVLSGPGALALAGALRELSRSGSR
jgi:amino acid adenylation domain-containing protein/non-ribosomal peptide synthase protein (TIGR01720 family)